LDDKRKIDEACDLHDVWDFRGTEPAPGIDFMSIMQFRNYLAKGLKDRASPHRTALVVDDDVSYGMTRTFQTISAQLPSAFSVFRDLDAACAWAVGDAN